MIIRFLLIPGKLYQSRDIIDCINITKCKTIQSSYYSRVTDINVYIPPNTPLMYVSCMSYLEMVKLNVHYHINDMNGCPMFLYGNLEVTPFPDYVKDLLAI